LLFTPPLEPTQRGPHGQQLGVDVVRKLHTDTISS
jgi:hypothetical protein